LFVLAMLICRLRKATLRVKEVTVLGLAALRARIINYLQTTGPAGPGIANV